MPEYQITIPEITFRIRLEEVAEQFVTHMSETVLHAGQPVVYSE